MAGFEDLGLNAKLLTQLGPAGLTTPTPIQARAIPHVMAGRDVMGLAQTGTGKTAAFGLPLLHRLLTIGHPPPPRRVRSLILAPTRELANQIAENLTRFTRGTAVRVLVVVGGASINVQTKNLARGANVLVATPGRLIDLLERGAVDLEQTAYLVLDEADQMLDLGFIHYLRRLARLIPAKRQTLLFSATMPKQIAELAGSYLRDPVRVEVAPPGQIAERIDQALHFVSQGDKARLLEQYLQGHPGEAALVFMRTKHTAEKLKKLLQSWGIEAGSIHGNKSQNQRDATLKAFRAGELAVLVATDVAARGLDIPLVRHVYNYDLPNVPENYVHRIGRTARAGAHGRAIAFCAPGEVPDLEAIEARLDEPLSVIGGERPNAALVAAAPRPGRKPSAPRPARNAPKKPAAGPSGDKPRKPKSPRPPRPSGAPDHPARGDSAAHRGPKPARGGRPGGPKRPSRRPKPKGGPVR
ncbi:MAG: DEAD/DEAH box helicase [Paracoccaceae bacterium]